MQGQDNEKEDHRNRIPGGKVSATLSRGCDEAADAVREDQAGYNSDNNDGRDA